MSKKKQSAKSETKKAGKPKAAGEVTARKARNADTLVAATTAPQVEALAVQPVQKQPAAQPPAAAQKAPKAAKSTPEPKAPREERNGVKRPKDGGKCATVWSYLHANPTTTAKDIREVAAAQGWNSNNAQIELSQWRKFMGLTKPKSAAK